jgi:hypothetical protein
MPTMPAVIRNTLLLAALAVPASAMAQPLQCPTEQDHATFGAFRDRIANAPTPEAARALAHDQTRLGHRAIEKASKMFPGNAELATADAKLAAFESGVDASATQGEVAAQVDKLMDTQALDCQYTTVEVVIIVIGFLLGILPGILFLFLFC